MQNTQLEKKEDLSLMRKISAVIGSPVILIFAFLGIFIAWFITRRWGVGLTPDSSGYISAARGLLNGQGMIEPPLWHETHPMLSFPPLLSLLLAGIGLSGLDVIPAARLLNVPLFGANILLIAAIIFHYTRSKKATLIGSFFVLTSLVTLEAHTMAWSEPIFLFTGFLGLFLLMLGLEQNKKILFIPAALLTGLAFLAKYSGISFVGAAVLTVFFFSPEPFFKKMRDGIFVGILGYLPMLPWMVRNRLVAGSPIELTYHFHPYILGHVRQIFAYTSMWLVTETASRPVRGIAALLFIGMVFYAMFFVFRKKHQNKLPWVFVILIFCHLGTYLGTSAFLGEQPFDNRALSPVLLAGLIFLASLAREFFSISQQKKAGIVLNCVIFVLGFSFIGRAFAWGNHAAIEGLGYANRVWKTSPTMEAVTKLPPDMPVYTNGRDILFLLTGRPATSIPSKEEILMVHVPDPKERYRAKYEPEIAAMKEVITREDGVVIFFNNVYWRWYYPPEKEIVEKASLVPWQTFSDGTIYKIKTSNEPNAS